MVAVTVSAMADKYTLHSGGETFDLGDSDRGLLNEWEGETGTVMVNLDNGRWLTAAVGPGIPIAITREPRGTATVRSARR